MSIFYVIICYFAGKGPYLKATKDLKPMDKIFEDHPLSSGIEINF